MIPNNITREHIINAINEIENNNNQIPPNRMSMLYLLEYNGKTYPPKYVVSLANKYANGIELDHHKFSGGPETNYFLTKLGFNITPLKGNDEKIEYWKIIPGVSSENWEDCKTKGFIYIMWGKLGDISNLTEEEFDKRCEEVIKDDPTYKQVSLNQVWDFAHIPIGSIIVANEGNGAVLGFGRVTDRYYFVDDYLVPHRLPVEWFDTDRRIVDESWGGKWMHKLSKEKVEELQKAPLDVETKIWWVNQGKNLDSEIERGYLWAPIRSKSGKTFSHWSALKEVLKGDIILHYANGAIRYVSKVKESPEQFKRPDILKYEGWEEDGWRVMFEPHQLNPPIPLNKFNSKISKLSIEQGPLDVNNEVKQGYLFRFSEDAVALIQKSQPETKWPDFAAVSYLNDERVKSPKYLIEEFCKDTGFSIETIQGWERRLKRKKQIIFQGPPGTGKTFVSQRLAKLLISETEGFCDLVQFHPSYAYEDFILGIRPKTENGQISYDLEEGRFLEFCYKAEEVPNSPCVLIIDEINRANLSRVFGELMYLLEYRENEIPLSGGRKFKIPENVYIIGTMNTADRSIALVDHALRRRFSFIRLNPEYDVLKKFLTEKGYPVNSLVQVLEDVNKAIEDPNYIIGISYFMKKDDNLLSNLPEIWMSEIEPYLEEFFFDQPEKADQFRWNKLSNNKLSDWMKSQ